MEHNTREEESAVRVEATKVSTSEVMRVEATRDEDGTRLRSRIVTDGRSLTAGVRLCDAKKEFLTAGVRSHGFEKEFLTA